MTNSQFLGLSLGLLSSLKLSAMTGEASPATAEAATPVLLAPVDYPEAPATYAGKLTLACSLSRTELAKLPVPKHPAAKRFLSGREAAKLADLQLKPFHAIIRENGADQVDGTPACESRPASRCLSTSSRTERPVSAPVDQSVGHFTMFTRDRGLDVVDGIPSCEPLPGSRCRSVPNPR
ncbi:MAG TPA: hypothetical protein VJJ83_05150 [Candidatus Babeliales bacterium]|nr:hypothetical protein [Candidatus Babeliales bacterium]